MTVTDHIRQSEMQSFCAGGLPASDTIRCAEHIETCPDCSRLFIEVSTDKQALNDGNIIFSGETLIIGQHLDYEEMAAYLDRSVGREQAGFIRTHLELCPECSKDLSSLREFRESIEPELRARNPSRGLLDRLASYLKQIGSSNPVQVLGAAALAVLLCLTVLLVYRWFSIGETEIVQKMSSVPVDEKSLFTILDNGKEFVVRGRGDSRDISNVAPELYEDALRIIRGEKVGTPASPQGATQKIRAAREKYRTHFELGVYFLREGLPDEARSEFRQLRSKNPGSKLVEEIYQRIGTENPQR